MADIAKVLHEHWHNVDRIPLQVVFNVRLRSGATADRDVKVAVDSNYEQLAWYITEVKARAVALAEPQMRSNERVLCAGFCLDALASQAVELELANVHGFQHLAAPTLYNPVHHAFTAYRELWVHGKLVLAKQFTEAFRYCVVPERLLSHAGPGVMPVLAI